MLCQLSSSFNEKGGDYICHLKIYGGEGCFIMRSIVDFVVRNKLAVWLLTILITVSGIYSGTRMKMETTPDVSIPFLMINTPYPGASPEQVMEEVSVPIERSIENLEGVQTIYSSSHSNMSSIQVEYDYDMDLDIAKREMEDVITAVTLPESVEKPTVSRFSMDAMPVLALSVTSSTDDDITTLTSIVEETIVPSIESMDDVANVSIAGQHVEEVELTYDEKEMSKLGITESSVSELIQENDLAVSLGLFEFKEAEQAVSIDGKFATVKELEDMQIPIEPAAAEHDSTYVKLGEIASIEVVGKVRSISRTNGEEAIAIQVVKANEANTVTVVNDVKDIIDEHIEENDGLSIDITLDEAEPIVESVDTMINKALFGGLIAALVILLFLWDFKSTIISIVSIPVSIFISILLLNWLDITLNIITLGAVTIAIGRVIDDSIVVVENIYRRLHLKEETLKGRAFIRSSTIEMFRPIASSTIVTIAVFAPLLFVDGMVGELLMPFAFTMSFALGASLLVAVTIVPALSHTLFKKQLDNPNQEKPYKKQGKFTGIYRRFLNWSLNHKIITSLVAVIMLIGSLMLTPFIGFSFMGSEEEKIVYLTYEPEPGELKETTIDNVGVVEQEMLSYEDVNVVQLSVTDSSHSDATTVGGMNEALMYVIFDSETEGFSQIISEVNDYLETLDHSGTWSSQAMASGDVSNNELSYMLYGEDLTHLNEAVDNVEKVMEGSNMLRDISSSMEESFDEFILHINQKELVKYGLTTGQVAVMLNPHSANNVLTTVEKDGEDLQVIVQKDIDIPTSIDELLEQEVSTNMGEDIELSNIVEVEEGKTPNTLERSKGKFYASVTGTVIGDDLSKAAAEIDDKLSQTKLPKGVDFDIEGVAADMQDAFIQLIFAMITAIVLVYLVLVITFSEGLAPFAILFSLPFTVIGSFVGLLVAGETISIPVMMGLLMLIGIVVTNAIVLVDRMIRMEQDGMILREAILEAGVTRLRPILMTAMATIGALTPLAFGTEGSVLISKGLAISVIGGLASSTLLTLIIVPVVYEVLSKLFKKNRKETKEVSEHARVS